MIIITKQDKYILESFIENSIPTQIKEQTIGQWDLMDCYEELFNYSQGLLCGHIIELSNNSYGTGKSFVFNREYESVLLDLTNNNDTALKIHCYLSLATLSVLQKYAQ